MDLQFESTKISFKKKLHAKKNTKVTDTLRLVLVKENMKRYPKMRRMVCKAIDFRQV